MKVFGFPTLTILIFTNLLFWTSSYSSVVILDANSALRNRTVYVGDIIIFRHKYYYNLYIFRNQIAFHLCNITEATLLSKQNSTSFSWHPSRIGFYYFTLINGSLKTCKDSQKLTIQVTSLAAPPEHSMSQVPPNAAPPGSESGKGYKQPGSTFPWPLLPHQANSPAMLPSGDGGLVPFINSNPAVPLPSTLGDSAAANPLPISSQPRKVMDVPIQILQLFLGLFYHFLTNWTSV